MSEQNQELAIAEAQLKLSIAETRLMIAACDYVDAALDGRDLADRAVLWWALRDGVADYRAALQGPPLPADHPLVVQGMVVVRRLLAEAVDSDHPIGEWDVDRARDATHNADSR